MVKQAVLVSSVTETQLQYYNLREKLNKLNLTKLYNSLSQPMI